MLPLKRILLAPTPLLTLIRILLLHLLKKLRLTRSTMLASPSHTRRSSRRQRNLSRLVLRKQLRIRPLRLYLPIFRRRRRLIRAIAAGVRGARGRHHIIWLGSTVFGALYNRRVGFLTRRNIYAINRLAPSGNNCPGKERKARPRIGGAASLLT